MTETTSAPAVDRKAAPVLVVLPTRYFPVNRAFYVGMAGTLLALVVMGFGRTLYFRPFFALPPMPPSVWVHGLVMTAWFIGAFLQTILVVTHRVDVHRRLGWAVAGIGAALLGISTAVTLNFPLRRRMSGADIEAGIASMSSVVWADLSALAAFGIFLSIAVALRRRPESHKRLMLLCSMSILQPATNRIWRWPIFDGLDVTLSSLAAMFLLLLAVGLYDVATTKRVHPVTLVGGTFLMGSRIVAIFMVATSEIGRAFVRGLA